MSSDRDEHRVNQEVYGGSKPFHETKVGQTAYATVAFGLFIAAVVMVHSPLTSGGSEAFAAVFGLVSIVISLVYSGKASVKVIGDMVGRGGSQ